MLLSSRRPTDLLKWRPLLTIPGLSGYLAVSSRMKNVNTYKEKLSESYQRLNGLTYFKRLISIGVFPRQNIADALHSEQDEDIVGITRSSFRVLELSIFR